jgi:hypothetical protein
MRPWSHTSCSKTGNDFSMSSNSAVVTARVQVPIIFALIDRIVESEDEKL